MKLTHRWTPSWRAARSLLLLGLVAGTLAACASTEPDVGPPGSLTLTVGGLPTGSTTDITISGPNGYSSTQTMGTAPVTITDLEPGDYTITGTGFTAGGISYVPIPATQTAEVTSDAATDASVGFGSFVFVANMRAEDITPDGSTALLTDVNSITADFYFYNTGTNTNTFKAAAGDALFNFATGISSTLRVSAIHGKPEQAGLWTEAGGWQDLGNIYPDGCEYDPVTLEQNESGGWDIDAAGQSAVGLVWNLCNAEAFLWTEPARQSRHRDLGRRLDPRRLGPGHRGGWRGHLRHRPLARHVDLERCWHHASVGRCLRSRLPRRSPCHRGQRLAGGRGLVPARVPLEHGHRHR